MKAINKIQFQVTPSIGGLGDNNDSTTFDRGVITIRTEGDAPNVFKIAIDKENLDLRTFLMVEEAFIAVLELIKENGVETGGFIK